jgi:CIC family chloride channel protein
MVCNMAVHVTAAATRFRIFITRLMSRIGFRDSGFLLIVAVLIGVVTAPAAVGFHLLIQGIRNRLYASTGSDFLYSDGLPLLILWPALGGLAVGIITQKITRSTEGHGVVDVMESVIRSSGFIKPSSAIEKILTSAITIGSGGSTGAEGPIVQIGAAIASGVGQFFGLARQSMPIVIACGTAAGISAIFNAPIGGLLFTLEVILQDFSIRSITPVVIASVIANVCTQMIFRRLDPWLHHTATPRGGVEAIFHLTEQVNVTVSWPQLANFALLGILCGLTAVALIQLMNWSEHWFAKLPVPRWSKPGVGGAMLGTGGVVFVLIFGRILLHQPKPISFQNYPMPAFFGDGYGAIQQFLIGDFYTSHRLWYLVLVLAVLVVAKLLATCATVCSGGGGGVIAPALFLGATVGGLLGILLRTTHVFGELQPQVYALVGMAGVLAAVVHAPLAAILILLELTRDNDLVLPAMLASIVATGVARRFNPDSVYTLGLRQRGVRLGATGDMMVLRRITVEQVGLDPAAVIQENDPFQRVLDLTATLGSQNFVVIDGKGLYLGMVVADDINLALIDRDAVPLLLVAELMRREIPFVRTSDDLATVSDVFSRHAVSHLPVCLPNSPGKIIGLISQAGLMRKYQSGLAA